MSAFDPYHIWLGIPADQQPPHHYRLLGLQAFESNADVIAAAADRHMAYLKANVRGEHAADAQRLLNELAAARLVLLKPESRAAYDAELRAQLQSEPAEAFPAEAFPDLTASATAPSSRSGSRLLPLAAAGVLAVGLLVGWFTLFRGEAEPVPPDAADQVASSDGASPVEQTGEPSESPPSDQIAANTPESTTPPENTPRPETSPNDAREQPTRAPRRSARNSTPDPDNPAAAPPTVAANTRSPANTDTSKGDTSKPGTARAGTPSASPAKGPAGDVADSAQAGRVICPKLVAKTYRAPENLVADALPFFGPGADGRRGAAGFLVPAPANWASAGTRWRFKYQRQGSARGVQIIHPYRSGHVLVTILDQVTVSVDGDWAKAGYGGAAGFPVKTTRDYDSFIPFDEQKQFNVDSRLHANGWYTLAVDGKILLTAKIDNAQRLSFPDSFEGEFQLPGFPLTWSPDTAGVFVGPQDQGLNIAENVTLGPAGLASTATASTKPAMSEGDPGTSDSTTGDPTGDSTMAEAPPARPAIPDKAAQAAARKRIDELFKVEFTGARSPDAKGELAEKLYLQGYSTEDDSDGRYALLDRAYGMALEIGRAELALRAAVTLAELYDVDGFALQLAALQQIQRKPKAQTTPPELADAAQDLMEKALAARQYDAADDFATVAMAAATKNRDTELKATLKTRKDDIQQRQRQWKSAEEARVTLETTPDDPAAHAALGKFLCFVADDWPAGLPHLAKSGDETLTAVAEVESAAPTEPAQQSAAGDAWWTLSQASRDPERSAARSRAAHWYRQAAENLTGLEKAAVDKRLKEIDSAAVAKASASSKKLTKGVKLFPGLVGRARCDGVDVGVMFGYQPNAWFRDSDFRGVLAQQRGVSGRTVEVQLVGMLQMNGAGDVAIRHAGGSASGGVHRLYINGQELGSVGDDRTKDTIYSVTLPKGIYEVKWVLTGGGLGSSLIYFEGLGGKPLPIVYTSDMLKLLRSTPTSAEVNLSSATR